MLLSRRMALIAGLMPLVLAAGPAFAQTYPDKPVRIVTSAVGGGGDIASRIISQGVSASFGQPIVVENRSSTGAIEAVVKAPADGYTLLLTGGSFWVGPLVRKASYDPVKDFVPVALVAQAPQVIVVTPSLPVKTVAELIALAKAKPGELNYASGAQGGNTHLAGELFKSMTGTNITSIPFRDEAVQMQALLSGDVHLAFDNLAAVIDHVKSGRLRAIAVTSTEPSPLMPNLPTVAATVPGYEMASRTGLFAPAGTPPAVIARLHQEIGRYLSTPEGKQRFIQQGVEAVGGSADDLSTKMKAEMARLEKLIKDVGLRIE